MTALGYTVRFDASASADVEAGFAWYERLRSGLGDEFVRSVAAGAESLERNPERFPVSRPPFRWVKLRRFPYGLHFVIQGEAVTVLACLHFRQSPSRWPGTQ